MANTSVLSAGAVLGAFCVLTYLLLITTLWVGAISVLVLQIRNRRLREVK